MGLRRSFPSSQGRIDFSSRREYSGGLEGIAGWTIESHFIDIFSKSISEI